MQWLCLFVYLHTIYLNDKQYTQVFNTFFMSYFIPAKIYNWTAQFIHLWFKYQICRLYWFIHNIMYEYLGCELGIMDIFLRGKYIFLTLSGTAVFRRFLLSLDGNNSIVLSSKSPSTNHSPSGFARHLVANTFTYHHLAMQPSPHLACLPLIYILTASLQRGLVHGMTSCQMTNDQNPGCHSAIFAYCCWSMTTH